MEALMPSSTAEPRNTDPRPAPILGSDFAAPAPVANGHSAHLFVVKDGTSPGTWTGTQLRDTVWSTRYAGLFMFNRSPWVEHGYVGPIEDVTLLAPGEALPAGAWVIELLDTSDQPGALGYHEGQAHISKAGPSGVHSERGVALHPATGEEMVVMKVFIKTSREDGALSTEVVTHELFEAAVDPYVNNESEIRAYKNPADGKEYIGEVGDPVQARAWDVGAPEGRPCGVPEAMISDFADPGWWGQEQRRTAVCFTDDAEEWKTLPNVPRLKAFEVGAGGYMSVRAPGGQWEQVRGAETKPGPNKQ
jgi:hypothetical protein